MNPSRTQSASSSHRIHRCSPRLLCGSAVLFLIIGIAQAQSNQSSNQSSGQPSGQYVPELGNVPAQPAAQSPVPLKSPRPTTPQINPLTDSAAVSSVDYRPMTKAERWDLYVRQNYTTTGAYLGVIAGSLIDQANGQPPEWGGGVNGYGRRLASRFATGALQGTIQYAGSAALGLEPRYIRSNGGSVARRFGHAFLFSFVTYNNEGKIRLNLPNLGSYYASSMIATTWQPRRFTALGDGVRDGNRQVVTGVAFNFVQEFWPEITRVFHRH